MRSPKLTAMLALVLLIGLPVVAITGLLSNDAYQPGLGGNALGRDIHGPLDLYLFGWPTGVSWLYAFTQGLHVTVGLALCPIVMAKLWSVIPKLFEWPPVRSVAHAIERLALALLVGSVLFEFVTGILNIEYWNAAPFSFTQAHYYGAWVFIGALVGHVPLRLGTMRRSLRTRDEVFAATATAGDAVQRHPLVSPNPAPASLSRRALLTAVGGASAILFLQGLGEAAGGPLRSLAFLLPRGHTQPGPLGFPVNKTWATTGLDARDVGDSWRLTVSGRSMLTLSREQLLAMPQYSYDLPISCVEGWSTTQRWTGVRIRDLAALTQVRGPATLTSISLQVGGAFGQGSLGHEQVSDAQTLLALKVNGLPLPLDHGYPARVISPAVPGVHLTKWVSELRFEAVDA